MGDFPAIISKNLTDTRASFVKGLCVGLAVCSFFVLSVTSGAVFANPQMQEAAEAGDVAVLENLLNAEVDVNVHMTDGSTALHWAVLRDQFAAIDFLLANGADVEARNRNGVFPLYLAAVNGSAAVTELLLHAGADANATLPSGETVLMFAARTGAVEVLEPLLAFGALIDTLEPSYHQSALMYAARENHADAVALLLRYGAEPNRQTRTGPVLVHIPPCKGTGCGSEGLGINRSGVPDRGEHYEQKGGFTALLYAARQGHTDVVRELLDAGADIETTEANDIGPLLMALLNNQLETAHLLLDYQAKINVQDFWGRSPLFAAVDFRNMDLNSTQEDDPTTNYVEREPVFKMIERLLAEGADPDVRTWEWPPEKKWLYALNDVSWVDMTGMTPFIRAAEGGDLRVMNLLLEYDADPFITTFAGTTALMTAAGVNWTVAQTYTESDASSLQAAQLCLDLGLDVNATNSMGLTALLGAANRGFDDMIVLLAENGATLDVEDAVGRTALDWANGVFLAAVGAVTKHETIALLKELMDEQGITYD